jgi:hypothetical protein
MRKLNLIALLFFSTSVMGQDYSKDVTSVDYIIAALYDVISGPAGERDWERLKFICKPSVQFNTVRTNKEGKNVFFAGDLEKYIANSGGYFLKNPFFETEIGRKVHQFGPLVQVFSAYEARKSPEENPFDRGINSIQLSFDNDRWWVVNIMWTSETADNPIPQEFLHK